MNLPLKILITGTNKGIGNELVKQFLKFNQNSTIYATSREEPEKAYERWRTLDKANQVKCKYLNISSTENIREFAKEMEQEKVKIDILINNAGVGKAEELHREFPNLEWTKECLGINVVSQVILTEQLLPLLSDNCKIANLSSMYGGLKFQPPQTQARFSNPNITKQDILSAVDQYIKEVENKNLVSFSPNVYATSKMLLGAWSRFVVQRRWLKGNQKSICVTPGFCQTPMTQNMDPNILAKAHSSESGAERIHQTLFFPDLDADTFYHRARKSDFVICGQELPWE